MIRVVLADDHAPVRCRMRDILEGSGECEVVGEAANGRVAVELALRLAPDVIVLDIDMPEMNGLDAARMIGKILSDAELLILTIHFTEELVREALRIGIRSYVLKSDAPRHLLEAVRALARHQPYFPPPLTPFLVERFVRDRPGFG
jgi:DNA-binding NarL/FixJ family response regulator